MMQNAEVISRWVLTRSSPWNAHAVLSVIDCMLVRRTIKMSSHAFRSPACIYLNVQRHIQRGQKIIYIVLGDVTNCTYLKLIASFRLTIKHLKSH
jgi:hypothetical protein